MSFRFNLSRLRIVTQKKVKKILKKKKIERVEKQKREYYKGYVVINFIRK